MGSALTDKELEELIIQKEDEVAELRRERLDRMYKKIFPRDRPCTHAVTTSRNGRQICIFRDDCGEDVTDYFRNYFY